MNWHLDCSLHAARKAESVPELVPTRSGPRHPGQSTLQQGWTFSRDLLFKYCHAIPICVYRRIQIRQMELTFFTQLLTSTLGLQTNKHYRFC
jgi:hypothetical protein